MTVLMTGFPGFLGSALLPGILSCTDGAAMCLVQSTFAALAKQRVTKLNTADPACRGGFRWSRVTSPSLGWALAQMPSTGSPTRGIWRRCTA